MGTTFAPPLEEDNDDDSTADKIFGESKENSTIPVDTITGGFALSEIATTPAVRLIGESVEANLDLREVADVQVVASVTVPMIRENIVADAPPPKKESKFEAVAPPELPTIVTEIAPDAVGPFERTMEEGMFLSREIRCVTVDKSDPKTAASPIATGSEIMRENGGPDLVGVLREAAEVEIHFE